MDLTVENSEEQFRLDASYALVMCHKLHLECELTKSKTLLNNITAEGITFEEHTRELLENIDEEFPTTLNVNIHESAINLMKEWYDKAGRREINPPYDQSTFKFMNASFLQRIQ